MNPVTREAQEACGWHPADTFCDVCRPRTANGYTDKRCADTTPPSRDPVGPSTPTPASERIRTYRAEYSATIERQRAVIAAADAMRRMVGDSLLYDPQIATTYDAARRALRDQP